MRILRMGHIAQYVRECRNFNSEEDAVRSIRYGIKQLPDFFTLTFDQQELPNNIEQ